MSASTPSPSNMLSVADELVAWQAATYHSTLTLVPEVARIISPEASLDAAVTAARNAANVAHMANIDLVVGEPPAAPAADANEAVMRTYNLRCKIYATLLTRRNTARSESTRAINHILSLISSPLLAKIRLTVGFDGAVEGANLRAVWTAIGTGIQEVGAAREMAAAMAYRRFISMTQQDGEDFGVYAERWRVARALAASLDAIPQSDLRMAHLFISSLSPAFAVYKGIAATKTPPTATPQAAINAGFAWIASAPPPPLPTVTAFAALGLDANGNAQRSVTRARFRGGGKSADPAHGKFFSDSEWAGMSEDQRREAVRKRKAQRRNPRKGSKPASAPSGSASSSASAATTPVAHVATAATRRESDESSEESE